MDAWQIFCQELANNRKESALPDSSRLKTRPGGSFDADSIQ